MFSIRFLVLLAFVVGLPSWVSSNPYSGQHLREIKSLEPERIEGLLSGAGLGYAKAAELNGWPGPLHALELASELALDDHQLAKIEAVRTSMLAKARPLGADLIEAERALDALFAEGGADPSAVTAATARIGAIEAELRAVHLIAHIAIKPILSHHQIAAYAQARGYGAGHDNNQGHHRKH